MAIDWKETIFSDGSENFIIPQNPKLGEDIKIKLRVWVHAPVERVFLRLAPEGEQYLEEMHEEQEQDHFFKTFSAKVKIPSRILKYRFMIYTKEEGKAYQYWYNQTGLKDFHPTDERDFTVISDFENPDWAIDSIFYQIFPDRFYDGNSETNVQTGEIKHPHFTSRARKWGELDITWYDFFGGDLEGIRLKIPYLKDLGIGALYLTPIFTAPSNHKYDTSDFKVVDPHFGTNEAFAALVEELHRNGIRIILDAVINHIGSGHPWFNKHQEYPVSGAFSDPLHPNREFFIFKNNDYVSWQGYDTLVKLDYRSEKLRDEMYRLPDSVTRFWLREPYNIDGWRIDVANMTARYEHVQLHGEVWEEFRKSLKTEKRDCYLLGETFYDPKELVSDARLDGAMNYAGFRKPLIKWLKGEEYAHDATFHNGFKFQFSFSAKQMMNQLEEFRTSHAFQNQLLMYNLLDSHDSERFMHTIHQDMKRFKLGVLYLFSYIGITGIYYGDEIGMTGDRDPDCRRCMEWNEEKWNLEVRALFKKLIDVKRKSNALKRGSIQWIYADNHTLAYARFSGNEILVVVLSNAEKPYTVVFPIWKLGVTNGELEDLINGETFKIYRGESMIELKPCSGYLFTVKT
ncbi:MAG: alpha-amylase family glycosyl hydrolase [Chloroherpetonaceae bacterium]|nr:alpha-amylase family glycosyl hydrolase [Chloroherpetonaceae bacterium]